MIPGRILAGRYRLEERIGEGGMGIVFRAAHLELGREVAVKVMLPHVAAQPGASERFAREARVAAMLHHPGSVAIHDFGDDQGALFIVMDLMRGRRLRGELTETGDRPLRIGRVIDVGAQVADVLVAAHRLELVHRDLKPENIFLEATQTGSERVVVVDFGLAFVATPDARLGRLTESGLIAGSLPYLAPEQARGAEVGPAADVYALGCILYEMVTGRPPFEGEAPIVLTRHLFVPPTPPRRVKPDRTIPGVLDDLIVSMLRKDPRGRPLPREVRDALIAIDPVVAERRERAREEHASRGRAARMITLPPGAPPAAGAEPIDTVRVRAVGSVDPELAVGLAANGFILEAEGGAPADLVFAPGAEPDALRSLAEGPAPVVSDAAPGDLLRVRELLRCGVAEIVLRPVTADALARKLSRLAGRVRRSPVR